MKLVTERTWDDIPTPKDERAEVWLRDEGSSLAIRIMAPWKRDPHPPGPPGPTDRLWEHEVVEVFVAGPGDPVPYTEIEVGPYGHYLVLRLEGVRNAVERLLPADVDVTREGKRWIAHVRVASEHLPERPWRVNATACFGQGEDRDYTTAARLTGDKPDFHQPDAFVALLPEP